jgi:hypothetical protein
MTAKPLFVAGMYSDKILFNTVSKLSALPGIHSIMLPVSFISINFVHEIKPGMYTFRPNSQILVADMILHRSFKTASAIAFLSIMKSGLRGNT